MKRKRLVIISSSLLLAITVGVLSIYMYNRSILIETTKQLKKSVANELNDPDSARFRSVRLISMSGTIPERISSFEYSSEMSALDNFKSAFIHLPQFLQLCGEINGKNLMGAYVGYKEFWVMNSKEPDPLISSKHIEDLPKKMCDIGKDAIVYEEPDTP